MEHDTRQIRSAARRIGTVAASVKDISSSDLRSISNSIPNNFQGESAEALQEAVSNLIDDLNQMSIGLNNIKASLLSYANDLDKADAEAAQAINNPPQ